MNFRQPEPGGIFRGAAPKIESLRDAEITLAAFVLSLLLAVISYYCLERPILTWGHRFRYADTKKPALSPSPGVPVN